jgi:cell division transport system ATP-binding protein
VALPLRVQGREEATYRAEVTELLGWVGLGDRMHMLPPVLSGGEKQRAAIARALIVRPELLLADEPTGNLDRKTGERIIALLREAAGQEKRTVVVVTHDEKIAKAADRRLEIEDGVLREIA